MATKKKLLQAAAGTAAAGGGAGGLNVEDVFSTYLWTTDSSDDSEVIPIPGDTDQDAMVWIKNRDAHTYSTHAIVDTLRTSGGLHPYLFTQSTDAEYNYSDVAHNYTGSSIQTGTSGYVDGDSAGLDFVAWTFRKAPKFFDVVTYTGTGSAQTIAHNLGTTVGCLIIKRTDSASSDGWIVYHDGFSKGAAPKIAFLNTTDAAFQANSTYLNSTYPTDTHFSVGSFADTNASGGTYVAYLFAHNDGDGEFGPDGDADIIKCGSYTGNGSSTGPVIDLGFEPQWFLVKRAVGGTGDWLIVDSMRGMVSGGNDGILYADLSNAEATSAPVINPLPTGFQLSNASSSVNGSGSTYIYIAIRRGPMAVPTDATEVFDVAARVGASGNQGAYRSGFPVDMAFHKVVTSSLNPYEIGSRLTQGKSMNTPDTSAEITQSDQQYDYMDGWNSETSASSSKYSWMWRRAPSFFDVVAYTGNGTAGRTVSHNLGVAPEMMWVKRRDGVRDWYVYHSALGNTGRIKLNTTDAVATGFGDWGSTDPTSSVFSVGGGTNTNGNGNTYIAYLFASLDGVSKVGSYTGTGAGGNQIDCGFSSGARFVLIKAASSAGSWNVFDTERGIVAGNDARLKLNNTNAEDSTTDIIDPYNSGFELANDAGDTNSSGVTYVFYAIA